jgi:hypothetical protein
MFNFFKKNKEKDRDELIGFGNNLKLDSIIILDKETLFIGTKYINVTITNYVTNCMCCKPLLLTESCINELFKKAINSIYSDFINENDTKSDNTSDAYSYSHEYKSDSNTIVKDNHNLLFEVNISEELCKNKQSALIIFKELNIIEFTLYNYINNKKISNDSIIFNSIKTFKLLDYKIDNWGGHKNIFYTDKLNNSCKLIISLKSPCINNDDIITLLESFKFNKALIKKEQVNSIILESKIYNSPYDSYGNIYNKENTIRLELFGPCKYNCTGSHFIERHYEDILDFYIDYFNETKINGIKKE